MGDLEKEVNVAVIGQDGLAMDALLEEWVNSPLAAVELSMVSAIVSTEVQTAFYDGRPLAFHAIDDFDFSTMDLVIVLEKATIVEAYKDILKVLVCPVLGFMTDLSALNPKPFNTLEAEDAKVLGLAQPAVLALKSVLQGLVCESVDVKAFYPVSFYGKEGVAELAAQTASLLNAQPLVHNVFQAQMPFNYFPMASSLEGEVLEKSLVDQLQLAFDTDDVHVFALQMPVFHGMGLSVSVICADVPDVGVLTERWIKSESITYSEACQNISNYDLLQLEGSIQLGLVQQSESDENRLDLWLGFDEAKFGVGKNLIAAAEFLLKHDL